MTQPNRVRAQKKLQSGKKDSDTPQPQSSETSQLPTPPPSSSSTSRSSSPPPQKLTRKQKRKAALAETFALEVSTTLEAYTKQFSDAKATPKSNATSNSSDKDITTPLSNLHLHLQIAMSPSTRLLICSIGNPAPYTNTLHSAGHTILSLLAPALSNPPFSKSRAHGNGLLSSGSIYTLWKSSSLMNISGTGVNSAWTTFQRESSSSSSECKLIVIHDELELAPGKINIKPGSNSPKGHNGLKSIRDSLRGQPYTRIGIGIGRPDSRDANVVAGYVLRKMSAEEKRKIEGCVGKVMEELQNMSGE